MHNLELKIKDIAITVSQMADSPYHGQEHWHRVALNAVWLMGQENVSCRVPIYFAWLHDCMREDEDEDLEHGPRAAELTKGLDSLLGTELGKEERELLQYAIRHHTSGFVSESKVIGICWDADRLDLGRVGIIPHEKYMSTESGKASANARHMRMLHEAGAFG